MFYTNNNNVHYVNPNFILEFFITWLKIVIASLDVFSITLSHVFTVMHCDYMRIFFHSVIVIIIVVVTDEKSCKLHMQGSCNKSQGKNGSCIKWRE